jgi:hypothetical protein
MCMSSDDHCFSVELAAYSYSYNIIFQRPVALISHLLHILPSIMEKHFILNATYNHISNLHKSH